MPRSLLMIDEFQEFFIEEDRVSQGAAVLLDRIVRQGRAFGIHVLLGSQTLGGAYTLARATIGQMVIRIALQCNEADAYLIMDQDNPAPRLLSRPGEGIYNDAAGAIEGNSPFQAVWLSDKTRDGYLAKIRARADQNGNAYPGPIVFEGNAPADVRENLPLQTALQKIADANSGAGRRLARRAQFHQRPDRSRFPAAKRQQSARRRPERGTHHDHSGRGAGFAGGAISERRRRFVLLDGTPPGLPQREFLERVVQAVPHEVVQGNNSNLTEVIGNSGGGIKTARRKRIVRAGNVCAHPRLAKFQEAAARR